MYSIFNLRYTLRLLRRSPGTAIVAASIIALGLAVAVPMYALIKSVAYGSLPFANEENIVRLMAVNDETGRHSGTEFDAYEYERMLESLQGFDELVGFETYVGIVSDGDISDGYMAANVAPALFSIMPENPLLGRTLIADDQLAGANSVVVLGYDVWQNYYAGNAEIIGEASRINGADHIVVGVMPAGYSYPEIHELWTPLRLGQNPQPGGVPNIAVMGLLNGAMDQSVIDAELNSFYSQIRDEFSDIYSSNAVKILPFTSFLAESSNSMEIWFLLGGIAFSILAIVSFNLANLLLVRANERTQELGIRNALGSTKIQLFRELLRESLVICFTGFLLGLILVIFVVQYIDYEINYLLGTEGGFSPPPWWHLDLTLGIVFVSILITFIIWISTAAFSAWKLYRRDIGSVIQGGATSILAGGKNRATQFLVGLEITLSSTLLIICGALFVAAYNGTHADFGIADESYLTGTVRLPAASYPDSESRQSYRDNFRTELLAQGGFVDLAFSTALPGMDGYGISYNLDDREFDEDALPRQNLVWAGPNFFQLFEVPLREGRSFDSGDNADSLGVVIVDEIFAATTWPGESPLGKRIQVNRQQDSEWLEVVGVTSHIIHDEPMAPQSGFTTLYRPIGQSQLNYFSVAVKVGSDLDSNDVAYSNRLKLAAARVDREVPVINVHSLERVMASAMNLNDMLGEILLGLAVVVFTLAIVALFAVVSRSIIARAREIGIRRALGSTKLKAIWIFIGQGFNYLAIAIPIGGGLGVLAAANIMPNIIDFEGVLIFVSLTVLFLITLMVLLASYLPARRIVAMEPGEALHYE